MCVYIYAYIYINMYTTVYIYFRRNKVYASWKLFETSISVHCGSHFQVPLVWQVWDGQIYYKILELLEGGNATGVRQSSMLGFYGERLCKRNETCSLFTVGSSIYLSHYTISYPIGHIQWPMVVSIPSFVGPQWCHARPAWQLPNTNENSSARAVPSTGGENSAHETLRRDGVEPGVRGTHRSQIWGVANGYPYIIHL